MALAADILHAQTSNTQHYLKPLLGIKEMSARLSEFESCQSSSDDEPVNEELDNEGYQSMNSRIRGWKQKRKHSLTPSKDSFRKKMYQNPTPPLK